MSTPFLTQTRAEEFVERLNRIQADDPPKFGSLTPVQLMRHLRYAFDMSLEKEPVPDESNFFTRLVIRILAFHWFTNWPGGKIKAPDRFTPQPEADFETEKRFMLESMQDFLDEADKHPDRKTRNSMMGCLTLTYWRRIHGLHLRHHCKQYGV